MYNGIDLIYLDYRKAFDTVPHAHLIEKLKSLGITGKLLDWIANFLHLRKRRVRVQISFSEWVEFLSGVPQGSFCSSYLSTIYPTGSVATFECLRTIQRFGALLRRLMMV